jgi:hypothetical protein
MTLASPPLSASPVEYRVHAPTVASAIPPIDVTATITLARREPPWAIVDIVCDRERLGNFGAFRYWQQIVDGLVSATLPLAVLAPCPQSSFATEAEYS